MKLTVVCNEFPYPPVHGGRADVFRRMRGFREIGVSTQLISWSGDHPSEIPDRRAIAAMEAFTHVEEPIVISRQWAARAQRLLDLRRYSSHVASRIVRGARRRSTIDAVRNFRPDAIFLDGLYGGEIATTLSTILRVPLFVRSHNIEHQYMRKQAQAAKGWRKKLALALVLPHLKKYELSLLRRSAAFFDISLDDLRFWESQGLTNGHWLPPLAEIDTPYTDPTPDGGMPDASKAYDFAFLGNLHAPNNVASVMWLVHEVWPRVRKSIPTATLLIAGSQPTEEICLACRDDCSIDLMANPASFQPLYHATRVTVNPMLTGSGVNMKSIDMLFTSGGRVSTSQGLRGLPAAVKAMFDIGDQPEDFASAMVRAYSSRLSGVDNQALEKARSYFLRGTLGDMTAVVQRKIDDAKGM